MAVSEKPWSDITPADYATPERYCAACLIDLNTGTKSKALCKLPIKTPGGAINRGAVHAAAAVLAGGRGGVQAPAEAKQKAARSLIRIYRNDLKETPPDSLLRLAA